MRYARQMALSVIVSILFIGCATGFQNTRPDITPLERAQTQELLMKERYVTQKMDAVSMGRMAERGELTLAQIQVYRIKKDLLEKAEKLIDAYSLIVSRGQVPSDSQEQEVFDLLNYIGTYTTK